MNLRRTVSVTVTSAVVLGIVLVGATPASAEPLAQIPKCAAMLTDPSTYFDDFAAANGDTAVAYNTPPTHYGSDDALLQSKIVAWHGTNCTWGLSHSSAIKNFTISETALTPTNAANLRAVYASEGIVGVDEEPTLGGVRYVVNKHELDLLIHGRVWVAITDRNTSIEGYTMQAASYTLYDLEPWIFTGGF